MLKQKKMKMTTTSINKKMNSILNNADTRYLNVIGNTEQVLINTYQNSLKEVEGIIANVYATFGKNPSITEVRKLNRLRNIQQDITREIQNLHRKVNTLIGTKSTQLMQYGYYSTGFALEVGSGVNLGFNLLDKNAIKYAAEDNLWFNSLRNNHGKLNSDAQLEFEMVLRANAREEVISGIAEGKSLRSVQHAIKDRFDVSLGRSKTIARTELHKSYMKGQTIGMNTAVDNATELGIESTKVWNHNLIGDPRGNHQAAEGRLPNKKGLFNVGGEKMQAPGLGTRPENNINCHCTLSYKILDDDIPDVDPIDISEIDDVDDWLKKKNIPRKKVNMGGKALRDITDEARSKVNLSGLKRKMFGSKFNFDRNMGLARDYFDLDMPLKDIATKYGLSELRARQIALNIKKVASGLKGVPPIVPPPIKPFKIKSTTKPPIKKKINAGTPLHEMSFSEDALDRSVTYAHRDKLQKYFNKKYGVNIEFDDDMFVQLTGGRKIRGMKLKDVQLLSKEMDRMYGGFSEVSGVLEREGRKAFERLDYVYLHNKEFLGQAQGYAKGKRVLGNYNPHASYLNMTTVQEFQTKRLVARMKPDETWRTGDWTISDTWTGTFRHEVGHHLDYLLQPEGLRGNYRMTHRRTQMDIGSLSEIRSGMNRTDIFKKIGKYANTNDKEFFAECFSVVMQPEYWDYVRRGIKGGIFKTQGNRLPLDIEKWFIEIFEIKGVDIRLWNEALGL